MADVISERGKKKISLQPLHFLERWTKFRREITFWRCSNRYKSFCKARLHTVDGLVTKELHKHSHLQEERHVQIAIHVRVSNGDARTNNKVEGHHNLINKMLSMQHPTIWKFIEALRKLQNINKNKTEALCAQGPPAKRRKYKDLDVRLKTIVEDFANRDILDFLRGIAHNLQFVQ